MNYVARTTDVMSSRAVFRSLLQKRTWPHAWWY